MARSAGPTALYHLLDVDPSADPGDIRASYAEWISTSRALAFSRNPEHVNRMNAAFQILLDRDRRTMYDDEGIVACPYCGHRVREEEDLWSHLRLHSGVFEPPPGGCMWCHRQPTRSSSFEPTAAFRCGVGCSACEEVSADAARST